MKDLKNLTTLELIEHYGLSVRQVPHRVKETFDVRHFKEGDELETITYPSGNTRTFVVRYKYPEFGGYWMTKKVGHTGSQVSWDMKTDNLAPTLSESVFLAVSKLDTAKTE